MPREEIFRKYKEGTLKSGSGQKVKSRKQAVAIAMSYPKSGKGEKKAGGGYVGSPVASGGAGYAGGGVIGQNGQMPNRRKQRKMDSTPGRYAQGAPSGKGGFKVSMKAMPGA